MSGVVNDQIRHGPRKTYSCGRRLQLAFRGLWMIGLGAAGLWAAWTQR